MNWAHTNFFSRQKQLHLVVILAEGRSIIERTDLGFASNLIRVLISLITLKNASQSWGV